MSTLTALRAQARKPLSQAHSLPFAAYTDDEVFAAEVAAIFHDEWVFTCMAGELAKPGDYYALSLAGEPVVVLRADDGLRAYSNTCRHRGTQLLDDGFGSVDRHISCPYHAWTYDLEGALKTVPFDPAAVVDKDGHSLKRFRVDVWNGLVFVHLGSSPYGLSERLTGIDDYLAPFAPWTFDRVYPGEVEHWRANWKVVMENAMESYHLFKVHAKTLEQVTPTRGAYYLAGCAEWSLTGGGSGRAPSEASLSDHYLLVSLPPSFVGVFSGDALGWISVHPVDVGSSVIRFGELSAKDAVKGGEAFVKAFFAEDKWICERVMRSMTATLGRGGKLVDLERVVVDFHQFLASRLFGDDTSPFHENPQAAALWRGGA